jgi:hypothetical protein
VPLREAVRRLLLRAIFGWDRLRLAWLRWLVPGLEIHPTATPAFASARYVIEPGGCASRRAPRPSGAPARSRSWSTRAARS